MNWAAGTQPAPFQIREVMRRQPQAIGGTRLVKELASQHRRRDACGGRRWTRTFQVGILTF